ncbi:major facilitator superfamily transporter [Colletotrichum truncatum]|uniref:Major facilitator superfamily transporter n=1 Tax=Colletotrichum truncatum TaxID=5467 RepID=A0ACC3YGF9_COLTU|nr:major facilitator superfamily transporter [Colletotrichum truncatum]KAF6785003.1 major facilitator superfamily transporter [Colletotrichum truncatum]
MASLLRESPAGQLLRLVTRNRILLYPEEKPDFKFPEAWLSVINGKDEQPVSDAHAGQLSSSSYLSNEEESQLSNPHGITSSDCNGRGSNAASSSMKPNQSKTRDETDPSTEELAKVDNEQELNESTSLPISPRMENGVILVDWYTSNDADNPLNWSHFRRGLITFFLYLYTSVIYMSSAIYTPSQNGVMEEFEVNHAQSALGLALFVLGYGIGPLLFSPLGEVPSFGRSWVYIITMFLYVVVSIPTVLVSNYPGLMVLRFLQGFLGSPCLASGGATLGDMYDLIDLPYALIGWVSAVWCGPALGPLIAGWSVSVMGWRWSLLEALWAASFMFVIMLFFLPETSQDHILLRRAQRLRRLTGDERLMSKSEMNEAKLKFREVVGEALFKPMEITFKDPAMIFLQVYTSIVYGIYYSYFEVFPLVYQDIFGMSVGQMGIVFQCIFVANAIGIAMYVAYLAFYLNPRIRTCGFPVPEVRMVPSMLTSFGVTGGLFIFAWTARPNYPWIASVIGITVYSSNLFIVMQCIFVYIPVSYPKYSASLFAANDFFRSSLAFGCVLFGRPLFVNLGVDRGVSILAGLSGLGIIGVWILYFYGGKLRSMSRFATKD